MDNTKESRKQFFRGGLMKKIFIFFVITTLIGLSLVYAQRGRRGRIAEDRPRIERPARETLEEKHEEMLRLKRERREMKERADQPPGQPLYDTTTTTVRTLTKYGDSGLEEEYREEILHDSTNTTSPSRSLAPDPEDYLTTNKFDIHVEEGATETRFQELNDGMGGQMQVTEYREGGVNKQTPIISGPHATSELQKPASFSSDTDDLLYEDVPMSPEKNPERKDDDD
jgi:hypothetical protein